MKRQYPKRPVVGVGAIILDGEKILLEQRKNEPSRGKWSVPGGLDQGHTPRGWGFRTTQA